jgi:hypothetical protein
VKGYQLGLVNMPIHSIESRTEKFPHLRYATNTRSMVTEAFRDKEYFVETKLLGKRPVKAQAGYRMKSWRQVFRKENIGVSSRRIFND